MLSKSKGNVEYRVKRYNKCQCRISKTDTETFTDFPGPHAYALLESQLAMILKNHF